MQQETRRLKLDKHIMYSEYYINSADNGTSKLHGPTAKTVTDS